MRHAAFLVATSTLGLGLGLAIVACGKDDPVVPGGGVAEGGASSGTSGSSGASGASGTSGASGASGASGSSGTSGASGTSGSTGMGKRVFVSSTLVTGDLGGVTGADAKCQKLATDATLGGTWRAWVSTPASTTDARFAKATTPYIRLDGMKVAESYADMITKGTLLAPISVDEKKNVVPAGANGRALVWTNTGVAGGSQENNKNCAGWSVADNTTGVVGNALEDGAGWTSLSGTFPACVTPLRLYCFEQ